ncbi:sodium-coupled monocarboxylate transporter 1-like [Physella acuta]|uniref:sodium-coupled monocarboxylate transporter 1-like n=1 Tax=Physella acuta TaxID=109671 RepID=UPI0027DDEFAD|nr:sodium-coupled monocarboxylate transporter 1-like [Physella acuta]
MYGHTDATFQWEDYLVFSVMLAVSSVIGLYFGIKARRQKTASADDMLTGSGKLPVLPVAMSLSASFTSATTILGIPTEVYTRGGEQWLWCIGLVPCFIVVAYFILPVFYNLRLTNAYEYLELRYNRLLRAAGSLLFSVIILIYMAAVMYAPAVALSQVTGLSREISILAMGLICTFYTAIGGIRAVVWTDAFQLVVVWAGLLAVLFKGAEDAGGWTRVWEISRQGSRLPKFDMDPNPFIRHTFWTLLIGGGTNMMTVYGANQANLQRYASVRTLREAKLALILNLPMWIFYLTILCLLGLVMYAYYLTCDPLSFSHLKRDQLVPMFVLETMGVYPGLPGLFVATVFSASISTVSSGVNSLAAVTLEDLFKPCYKRARNEKPSKRIATIATICLTIFFGLLTILLTYGAELLGKTALTISFGVFGMVGGPLLGLIMNGIFIPFINSWGAGAGLITSLVACLYVGIDPVLYPPPSNDLPLRSDGCPYDNSSLVRILDEWNTSTTASSFTSTTAASLNVSSATVTTTASSDHLYLSYIHYSTLALIVSAVVGVIVSLLTCCNKGKEIDPRTYLNYSWCCPKKKCSSYNIHHFDDANGHKRNNNLVHKEVLREQDSISRNGTVTTLSSYYTYSNTTFNEQ